jgi:hypothetical protein
MIGYYQTSYLSGLILMKNRSATSLRRRRRALVRRLPPAEAILRGSLIERYKKCGKPGCRCAKGPGHGPKYYLSISQTGKNPQMDYIPQDYCEQVEAYLANYQSIKEILKEICDINSELLSRREKL